MNKYEIIRDDKELNDKLEKINNSQFKDVQVAIITNNDLNHPDFKEGEFSGYRPAFCNEEPGLCEFNPNTKVYYKNFGKDSIDEFINRFNSYNLLFVSAMVDNGMTAESDNSIDANRKINWTRESITDVKRALDNNFYAVFVNDENYYL